MKTYDYWVDLVSVDDESSEVGFRNDQTGVTFTMPKAHWIKIGRPGSVRLAPLPF